MLTLSDPVTVSKGARLSNAEPRVVQVLNLAPWGNVLLQLPPVRLSAQGWSLLGAGLGEQWLREITTNQVQPSQDVATP